MMTVQAGDEDDDGSRNSEPIVQQREKALEVHYTSRKMNVAVEKEIQTKMFQQGSRLDEEIDELWNLMQRCKRNNDSEVQTVSWMNVEDWEIHYRTNEQQQLQNKAWDPGKQKMKTHDQVVMIFSTLGV